MDILFSVWGGSVSFANTTENTTGNVEYQKFLDFLCDFKNVDKVIVACPTDADKTLNDFYFPIKNKHKLVFPLVHAKKKYTKKLKDAEAKWIAQGLDEKEVAKRVYKKKTEWTYRALEEMDEKPEIGFVFRGLGSFCYGTLADYCYTEQGTYRIPPRTALGAAQLTYYLNMTGVPWHLIGTDSRYFRNGIGNRDVSNIPISGLCQYNDKLFWQHVREFGPAPNTDEVMEDFEIKYAGIEMVSGYKEKIPNNFDEKEQNQMIVFSNWIDFKSADYQKNFRYKILRKWIIDTPMDCVIYGHWSDDCRKNHPEFAGHISPQEFKMIMNSMKCTFVLPQKIGWATWKIWEMIYKGVIPFLHPRYDNQYNILPQDHFIRVKDEKDLYEKFNLVTKSHDIYLEKINELLDLLDPKCNRIMDEINKVHKSHKIEPLKR